MYIQFLYKFKNEVNEKNEIQGGGPFQKLSLDKNYRPNRREIENILEEQRRKIGELEDQLLKFEARIPKKYPEVNYLNYLARKRILVSHLDNLTYTPPSNWYDRNYFNIL